MFGAKTPSELKERQKSGCKEAVDTQWPTAKTDARKRMNENLAVVTET